MKKTGLILLLFFLYTFCFSQDIDYARKIIDTLSSPYMYGRGYVNNGEKIAADFIKNEFIKDSLKTFNSTYLQPFNISINTFPQKISLVIDDKEMKSGVDYLVSSGSASVKSDYDIIWLTKNTIVDEYKFKKFIKNDLSNKVIIVDKTNITNERHLEYIQFLKNYNTFKVKAVIFVEDKLLWHIADGQKVKNFTVIEILKSSISHNAKKIHLDIKNKFFDNYTTNNIIGYVKGRLNPDSFIVFSAHYDHLGCMGTDAYFPGANDNASGTAMILNLAKYYSKPENMPDYSIAFMSFSAEEVGLLGSKYYSENPLFPLKNIKFLINLDMVGTGSEGIKIVNSTILKTEYNKLVEINEEKKYLKAIGKRGEAANSDHYFFYKNGVRSFFIYTLGNEYKEYHNINDKPPLPLTEYEDLFRLLRDFVKDL